jgi:hypothetical protein
MGLLLDQVRFDNAREILTEEVVDPLSANAVGEI